MYYDSLTEKIKLNQASIVVMGLGYVGLPLACELARGGLSVMGLDPDQKKIRSVQAGESYVDYPTSETLQHITASGVLQASVDPQVIRQADVVIICVPTPLSKTKDPDLSLVQQAGAQIAANQKPGQLVILESTSYPGTTRDLLAPLLTTGEYRAGQDVFIGYSPERIDPGNTKYNLTNTPKIVSGMTDSCANLTHRLYFKVNEQVVRVSNPETAEMAKVLENTFRAVNIGLANEVAIMCKRLGIDPFEVIDAAATKPFGFMPFYPGPGLGGHCIPIDPLYLSWKLRSLRSQAHFIDLADQINQSMPRYVVNLVAEGLNSLSQSFRNSRILIMGVTYKPDVQDMRESPALEILDLLQKQGAVMSYQDPHVDQIEMDRETDRSGLQSCMRVVSPNYRDFDLVVIVSRHREFDLEQVLRQSRLIVDTRGVLRDQNGKNIQDKRIFRI